MPKRLNLEMHLSTVELERRYRKAKDPILRTHLNVVWQLSKGKLTRKVTEATGYSARWVREIACRYNERGTEGLGDRRHRNPGGVSRALLTSDQRDELRRALKEPPAEGGMWNSRKVAEWIKERTGRKGVRAQRGWEYMRRLGYTPQVPRPAHVEADPEEQAAFKKSSPGG
jgi:transposase